MTPPTESGIPSHPWSGTQKPFHLVMCSRTRTCIVQRENNLQCVGGHMILENSAISTRRMKARSVNSESQEPAERTLMEAAKGGHSTAFAMLCERHPHQLLGAAHRIRRSREDAEDAVQNALLSAFVHLRDFDGRSSFPTRTNNIATNSAPNTPR